MVERRAGPAAHAGEDRVNGSRKVRPTRCAQARERATIVSVSKQAQRHNVLMRKIRSLPPEKVAEVEDFVEFLNQREDRQLTQAAAKIAERAFRRVWDNPADAAYDRL